MVGLKLSCLLAASLLGLGCLGAPAEGEGPGAPASAAAELAVRRGPFQERLLLTGELAAARAESLVTPRTDTWQIKIRWLAEDGTFVKAGDPVVEFDNSSFTSQMEEKRLAESDAVNQLLRMEAESKAALAEKEFAVEQARSALAKARVEAGVAEGVLSLREYQERQLALRRAEAELAKAEDDLAGYRKSSAADLGVQRISLEKSRRQIREAQESIAALTLVAPRDGMVLAGENPWEGTRLQEGDSAWPGMTVATMPDLSSMVVDAALSDVDDGRVAPGMRVVCTLDAYPARRYPGRVVDVSAVARESGRSPLLRSFPVRIALDRSDPQRMRPGMSVRVEVLGPEVKDALLVPRAALDLAARPPRALLAGGGTAPVRLGRCSATDCVVEEGLEPGTRLRSRHLGQGRSG